MRAIMAAAEYTISSSPPRRQPYGEPVRATGTGAGSPASRPAPAPQFRHARPVPFERSVAAACTTAARGRPAAGRASSVREAGFPRKI
ncbi:hypothetical protein BURMUCGD1_0302 [Burkholderia multivorans CGD1]|nr:hypothetical protein BURMUCGD1_0302 [Burkholderia multivorans CGD1]